MMREQILEVFYKTGDSTMIAPFVIVASLSLFALVTVIKKSKAIR